MNTAMEEPDSLMAFLLGQSIAPSFKIGTACTVPFELIEQNAQILAQNFRNQVIAKAPVLAGLMLDLFEDEEEGLKALDEIDELRFEDGWNQVSKFCLLAEKYSELGGKKWKIVPQASLTDGYVLITEAILCKYLNKKIWEEFREEK